MTALHSACYFRQPTIVQLLLQHGAAVDLSDESGYTPLHHAARAGHLDIALLLLDTSRASIDVRMRDGWTPLAKACWHCRASVVAALLERGPRTDIPNNEGETPLALAKIKQDQTIIVMLEEHEKKRNGWELVQAA